MLQDTLLEADEVSFNLFKIHTWFILNYHAILEFGCFYNNNRYVCGTTETTQGLKQGQTGVRMLSFAQDSMRQFQSVSKLSKDQATVRLSNPQEERPSKKRASWRNPSLCPRRAKQRSRLSQCYLASTLHSSFPAVVFTIAGNDSKLSRQFLHPQIPSHANFGSRGNLRVFAPFTQKPHSIQFDYIVMRLYHDTNRNLGRLKQRRGAR